MYIKLNNEGQLDSYEVLYDFDSTQYGEEYLTIKMGETVTAEFDPDDGWIQVKNINHEAGLVPFNYLEILNSESGDSFTIDEQQK